MQRHYDRLHQFGSSTITCSAQTVSSWTRSRNHEDQGGTSQTPPPAEAIRQDPLFIRHDHTESHAIPSAQQIGTSRVTELVDTGIARI